MFYYILFYITLYIHIYSILYYSSIFFSLFLFSSLPSKLHQVAAPPRTSYWAPTAPLPVAMATAWWLENAEKMLWFQHERWKNPQALETQDRTLQRINSSHINSHNHLLSTYYLLGWQGESKPTSWVPTVRLISFNSSTRSSWCYFLGIGAQRGTDFFRATIPSHSFIRL